MVGCDTVFHVASPYANGVKAADADRILFTPAVKGTENVLASVNKCESVTRVVLTSSCVAVYGKLFCFSVYIRLFVYACAYVFVDVNVDVCVFVYVDVYVCVCICRCGCGFVCVCRFVYL